jgi:hypothetical protein
MDERHPTAGVAGLVEQLRSAVDNPQTGIARIRSKLGNASHTVVDRAVNAWLRTLIQRALEQRTNGAPQMSLKGTRLFTFRAGPLNPVKPVRLVVQAEQTPGTNEIATFFSGFGPGRLRVESTAENSFRVWVHAPEFQLATDFLGRYADRAGRPGRSEADVRQSAWQSYCQLLFCLNEFLYLE